MTSAADAILVNTLRAATRALPSKTLQAMYRQARADGDRLRGAQLWELWVAARCREGDRPDALRRDSGSPVERFWACVIDGVDGHLVWTGRLDERKRPITRNFTSHWILAQRFAWRLKHGPITNVFLIHPDCGYEHCLNVDHLRCEHRNVSLGYRPEALIGAIQACALKLGRAPTAYEYEQWRPPSGRGRRGVPSAQAIAVRIGSWPKAVQAAGLEPRRTTSTFARLHDDAAILAALREFTDNHGHPPTYSDWGDRTPSYSTVRRRFGTWAEAITRAT